MMLHSMSTLPASPDLLKEFFIMEIIPSASLKVNGKHNIWSFSSFYMSFPYKILFFLA